MYAYQVWAPDMLIIDLTVIDFQEKVSRRLYLILSDVRIASPIILCTNFPFLFKYAAAHDIVEQRLIQSDTRTREGNEKEDREKERKKSHVITNFNDTIIVILFLKATAEMKTNVPTELKLTIYICA